MHPYRDPPTPSTRSSTTNSEELILYILLVAVGAIPLVVALLQRAALGADATLGGLMVGAGVLGAFGYARHRRPT